MEYILIAIATIAGLAAGWLLSLRNHSKNTENQTKEIENLKIILTEKDKSLAVLNERLRLDAEKLEKLETQLAQNLVIQNQQTGEISSLKAYNESLKEKLEMQKAEIEEMQKRLTSEFENIANRIMKQRSEEFSESNKEKISEILNPLKEKIKDFENKVEKAYDAEMRDKISLREELKNLTKLNAKISEDAENLTKALKGDVKKQGNWGEIVLERVLERSGLTKGQEYEREEVVEGIDASVQRPDVIVHLPDNKHIIIDSKVSLVAYERFVTADTEENQSRNLKEHIVSLRNHVKYLSEKNYQNAMNINTPDFVLMFVPIEASFSAAVQSDTDLFSYAWERKIVIVSPTTLLATLRTISSIWKQENQTRNAQEIARLSGALYDKFISFTEELIKIKQNIDRAADSYDEAVKKMKDGKGNILRTAERIKELGAKTGNKSLPSAFED
jgi:DNA recombination protein RmuC